MGMQNQDKPTVRPPAPKGAAIGQISAEELRAIGREWLAEGKRCLERYNDLERIADNLEGVECTE